MISSPHSQNHIQIIVRKNSSNYSHNSTKQFIKFWKFIKCDGMSKYQKSTKPSISLCLHFKKITNENSTFMMKEVFQIKNENQQSK